VIKNKIIKKALIQNKKIILPEKTPKIKDATKKLLNMGFDILDIDKYKGKTNEYVDYLKRLKFTNGWPIENIYDFLDDDLHFGMTMLAFGDGDSLVAGASNTTSSVIRSAIRLVGVKPDSNWLSSVFFMIPPNHDNTTAILSYADCSVIPDPSIEQLVSIAYNASKFHKLIIGKEPKVAFLSFSTNGSASHYKVEKIKNSVKMFEQKYPQILCEGEVQFDAAINTDIAIRKNSSSKLRGSANVLIFPDLDSGNIAYKITERLANYAAWGPLLQGLKKPVHDLSRGCSVDDIISVSAIAALQAKDCYANV